MTEIELRAFRVRNEERIRSATEIAAQAATGLAQALRDFTAQCERMAVWEREGRAGLEALGERRVRRCR